MKKRILSVLIGVMMIMAGCLAFAGCGSSEEESSGDVIGTCTVTIPDFCEALEIQIHEGDTVYDVTKATDVTMSAEDTGNGHSVEILNGIENGSEGEMSGWLYYVNGEMSMEYSDNQPVADGDEIAWEFAKGM